MKKLIVCLAILAVVSAQADVLIGSWEESTNEGWYDFTQAASHSYQADPDAWVDSSVENSINYWFSHDWYTDGYTSLKMNLQGASASDNWGNKVVVQGIRDAFLANSKLEFDVHSTGSWAQIICINLNSDEGWNCINGGWSVATWNSGGAQHVVVDYSAFKNSTYCSATDSYLNLVFQTQGGTDAYLYLDNVRLTPEPATMALLGLGGLALLRRKK